MQPETKPLRSVLGFRPQTPLPHSHLRPRCPRPLPLRARHTTTTLYTTHHRRLTWQARNQALVAWFRVFGPQPPPPTRVCEHDVHDRHHFERDATLPPCTTSHCRLTRQARNQALVAWFWVFGPQPPPPACVCERNVRGRYHFGSNTPPPPCITHQHCLTQQARNQATVAWFQGFGLQPPPLLRVCERMAATSNSAPATPPVAVGAAAGQGRWQRRRQQLWQGYYGPLPRLFLPSFFLLLK
jgi:hypothetical protein